MFERELLSVPVMRQVLGDTLRGIGVNEDSVTDILLAVTEACTNVVLHAGQSAQAYTVAATVDSAACRVEITDAGQGCSRLRRDRLRRGPVDHGVLDRGPADHGATDRGPADHGATDRGPADHGGLAESGRGFAIMRECVDAVTLRSAPGRGTRVVLDKRIHLEAPLPGAA